MVKRCQGQLLQLQADEFHNISISELLPVLFNLSMLLLRFINGLNDFLVQENCAVRLNSLQMELASPSTALSPAVKQLICCVGMGCDNKVLEDGNRGLRVKNETRDTDGIYVTSSAELKLDRVASLLPGNTSFNGACGTTCVHSDALHNPKHSSCS